MILSFCVTHKNTSVPLRESLTFKNHEKTLLALSSLGFVKECVLLQTCNRIEIHLVTKSHPIPEIVDRLIRFWSHSTKVSKDSLFKVVEVFEGKDALLHLLLLASGLESMVIGEDQILGQIRTAYLDSKEAGTTGPSFDLVFPKALKVGRKVRVQTRVNKGLVSVSSIAVDLVEKYLDNPQSAKVLIIGAGKTGTLAATELSKRNIGSIYVANRTNQKALELAQSIGGHHIIFEEIYQNLSKFNLIIAAISVDAPLLRLATVKGALENADVPDLLMVDLSQPRCIEQDVGLISGVQLITIDDLNETADENLQKRMEEALKARCIVNKELEHLGSLLKKKAVDPTISTLCRKIEQIRRGEVTKAFHMLNGINEEQRLIIENLTKELVERILHSPIENLRNSTLNGDNELLVAINTLFDIEGD